MIGKSLLRNELLLAFLCASAVPAFAQAPSQTPPFIQAPAASNTNGLAQEAAGWLAQLIKINTTSPPGNEEAAAKYVAGILQQEGIPSELLNVAPGRSALVARLSSSALPDPSRALLLVAHLDVVGVERSKWTVDPFAAVIKDGYIYGRGAIDDKGMLAANLAAFIALKRDNARLNRDVIFLASTDEEEGGDASITTLVAKYWNKFAAGYSVNEGGQITVKNGKVQYVAVQAGEKVEVNVTMIAQGHAGHASMPEKNNPVVHLAAALTKIGAYSAPARVTPIVQRYFEGLAAISDDETAKWMRALGSSDRGEHAQRILSDTNPVWNAMLRDTVSPTMLTAGVRRNVIPAEARATLNVRMLPGDTISGFLGDLGKLINDPSVRFEMDSSAFLAAPSSSVDSDFYSVIAKVAGQEFAGAPVLPFQSPWATDSAVLRLHNVQAYGLDPFPLTDDDMGRVHGNDERLSLAALAKGVDFTTRIVQEFAVAK